MAISTTPDERFMRRAIALSKRGFPAPNPHVGCVIVRDGAIIGEGFHAYAGGPHAEIAALAAAGEARGADIFVTLEPCRHFGRTPPCVDALIAAKVGRVVIAVRDPTESAGGGLEALAGAGIATARGLLAAEAEAANIRWLTAVRRQTPYVVVKAAASLDGRMALASGESRWITGAPARRAGHRLRAECGAVLVGWRTVAHDDPALTARVPGVVNPPVRVVLDPHGRLTGRERVFDDAAPTRWIRGDIDLDALLGDLFRGGITGILVEGGGATIASFFRKGRVDAVELFLAPKLLGDGPAWVNGLGLAALAEAPQLEVAGIRRRGADIQVSARSRPDSPR